MNNSDSAKRGFKTFILTLSISLILFSAVYYALTTYSPGSKSDGEQAAAADELSATGATGGDSSNVQGVEDKRTVFGEIVSKKPQVQVQEVLAGATSTPQTTQSTTSVPVTGFTEMTIGLLLSLGLFVGAMIYNLINPRKLALSNFEKKLLGKSK